MLEAVCFNILATITLCVIILYKVLKIEDILTKPYDDQDLK